MHSWKQNHAMGRLCDNCEAWSYVEPGSDVLVTYYGEANASALRFDRALLTCEEYQLYRLLHA